MFSIVATPIYILTNSAKGFFLLHILANTCCLCRCDNGYCNLIVILICTSLMISDVEHLFMDTLTIPFVCLLWKISIQVHF